MQCCRKVLGSVLLVSMILWAFVAFGRAQTAARVPELWASSGTDYANTDSLAACKLTDGSVRVFATAKDGDRVDVFDAATGKHVGRFGKTGDGPGELRYPNGIVTVDFSRGPDSPNTVAPVRAILVIERDNHRVQAFRPDTYESLGTFGAAELHRPYGGAVSYRKDGIYLYVTDTKVPLDQVAHVFRIELDAGKVHGRQVRVFGDPRGPGAIREAESLVVDDALERVLFCDEAVMEVKVYTLDGRYTGEIVGKGLIKGDPEGIVLWNQPQSGCFILTDQRDEITYWHVFGRKHYVYLGTFTGEPAIANTDGICLYPEALPGCPLGALFAVDDDEDLRAYSLESIKEQIKAWMK